MDPQKLIITAAILMILILPASIGQYLSSPLGAPKYACAGIAGIRCPSGYTCQIDTPYYPDKIGVCLRTGISANKCPSFLDYVCGADGATYTNGCYALTSGTTVACKGKCPCPATTCAQIWAPVCGSNGVTYSNTCKAQQASATVACNRACPCKICPASPVALCNPGEKRTNSYDSNGCPVYRCEKAPCRQPTPVSCGPSERIISEQGVDGCTRYRCMAFEETCKNRCGSFPWYSGKCRCDKSCLARGDCCSDYKEYCTLKCPKNIDPVCGKNGVTYTNPCEADQSGINVACKGQCPCKQACPNYAMPICPGGNIVSGDKRADGCTGPPKCESAAFASCHDSCGGMSKTANCHCDKYCENLNDCCADYKSECA